MWEAEGLLVQGQPRLRNETLSQTKQTPSLLWWSGVAGAVPGTIDGNSFYPWPICAVSDGWAW